MATLPASDLSRLRSRESEKRDLTPFGQSKFSRAELSWSTLAVLGRPKILRHPPYDAPPLRHCAFACRFPPCFSDGRPAYEPGLDAEHNQQARAGTYSPVSASMHSA